MCCPLRALGIRDGRSGDLHRDVCRAPCFNARQPLDGGGWSNLRTFIRRIVINGCPIVDEGGEFPIELALDTFSAILGGEPQGDIDDDQSVDVTDLDLLQTWVDGGVP